METVVVGVDRSRDSRAAVAWGVRQARTTGARLVLAHAYDVPDVPLGVAGGYLSHDPTELAQHALSYLETLASELDAPATTAFRVERDRLPARCLLEVARDADLLVVGSRRRGGFTRLVLGSVSQQCVQHALCPVVVVPAPVPVREAMPEAESAAFA